MFFSKSDHAVLIKELHVELKQHRANIKPETRTTIIWAVEAVLDDLIQSYSQSRKDELIETQEEDKGLRAFLLSSVR